MSLKRRVKVLEQMTEKVKGGLQETPEIEYWIMNLKHEGDTIKDISVYKYEIGKEMQTLNLKQYIKDLEDTKATGKIYITVREGVILEDFLSRGMQFTSENFEKYLKESDKAVEILKVLYRNIDNEGNFKGKGQESNGSIKG